MLELMKANKEFIYKYAIFSVLLYIFCILPYANDPSFIEKTITFVIGMPIMLLMIFYYKKYINPPNDD